MGKQVNKRKFITLGLFIFGFIEAKKAFPDIRDVEAFYTDNNLKEDSKYTYVRVLEIWRIIHRIGALHRLSDENAAGRYFEKK